MRRIFADVRKLVSELRFVGTMLLITVTALVYTVALGPSFQVAFALAGLALSHFLLELWRRRSRH